jgi:hypothetical protein
VNCGSGRRGVVTDRKHDPRRLTYRQAERTFGLVAGVLAKDVPDGLPAVRLQPSQHFRNHRALLHPRSGNAS